MTCAGSMRALRARPCAMAGRRNDLFGGLPARPGGGGRLFDRLRGARNLKMEGPKAVWSYWGAKDWTCAGSGDQLVSSGLLPIWELRR